MGGIAASKSLGERFGRLLVVSVITPERGDAKVTAVCDCGGNWSGKITQLRGGTKSCGCLSREVVVSRSTSHGLSHTAEYQAWQAIKKRCYNAHPADFHLYQGKGIVVCDRWLQSFENFYADMGPRPSNKHSIDRRDSNKNYEPSNCYWATATEQARNTSRNKFLEYKGRRQTLMAWCNELNLSHYPVKSRIAAGWSVERAFETPVKDIAQGVKYDFNGRSMTVSEWSRHLGVGLTTLMYRLKSGWSLDKTLNTPVATSCPKKAVRA